MREDHVSYASVVEYEQKRQAIHAHYTARLKSLSATDPEYGRLWDERANALRTLAEAYHLPQEGPA